MDWMEAQKKEQAKNAAKINKWLDMVDEAMADPQGGSQFYQILSGSVRGPDTGTGKENTTMRLRRICFPKTCSSGNTGMMSSAGVPSLQAGNGTGHFQGHVGQAISYLQGIGRWPATQSAVAAKKE